MDALPQLLLLEDDPPSRMFLHEVLRALPARVDAVETLAQVRAAMTAQSYDLWLFDARLPDGDSATLLTERRAAGDATPALVLTADPRPERRRELLAAGFAEVLIKPLSAAALYAATRSMLTRRVRPMTGDGVWDEAHALTAAGGVARTRDALRELFLAELPGLRERILQALDADDVDGAGASLHRLKGSCAFVGASALLRAAQALTQTPSDLATRDRFATECTRLLR